MTMGRPKRIPRPKDTTLGDLVKAGVRAAASAAAGAVAPVVGDGIAGFIGELFPAGTKKREDAVLRHLVVSANYWAMYGLTIEDLRENEDLHDIIWSACWAMMHTHRDEKRRAFRNAITNAALPDRPDEIKARVFLRLIDELDVHHLLLLELMANPEAFLAKRDEKLPGPGERMIEMDALTQHESPRSLASIARKVLRGAMPSDLDEIALQDLVRRGLTSTNTYSVLCTPGTTFTSPLGGEFVRFVADPPEPPQGAGG